MAFEMIPVAMTKAKQPGSRIAIWPLIHAVSREKKPEGECTLQLLRLPPAD
jgi:hypothetical protein